MALGNSSYGALPFRLDLAREHQHLRGVHLRDDLRQGGAIPCSSRSNQNQSRFDAFLEFDEDFEAERVNRA